MRLVGSESVCVRLTLSIRRESCSTVLNSRTTDSSFEPLSVAVKSKVYVAQSLVSVDCFVQISSLSVPLRLTERAFVPPVPLALKTNEMCR